MGTPIKQTILTYTAGHNNSCLTYQNLKSTSKPLIPLIIFLLRAKFKKGSDLSDFNYIEEAQL